MALKIDFKLTPRHLVPALNRLFDVSAAKVLNLNQSWNAQNGSPVFTVRGKYASRGWTEWTQGFQFGAALLQFDATGDPRFLELGRAQTLLHMAPHLTHTGVHDHGFNNLSTYGNLLRLLREGKVAPSEREAELYELALKVSGAVQAARWTDLGEGRGFIYSFNGPHSLFIDTLRSLRSLATAHLLGHVLMGERDRRISLLQRLVAHARTTAQFAIYYGAGRDHYDVRGRVAHESIFNPDDRSYRCPNSQQGYSPFCTWTRGLAWAICGFAEQLEFLASLPKLAVRELGGTRSVIRPLEEAALATADFYLVNTPVCGVPYWDTGAPNLHRLGNYLDRPAEPFNDWEPVDSSAAAIAAQGLLRLGRFLAHDKEAARARRYRQAGLTIAKTLLNEPYICVKTSHQGLLLHSVYHRPNGWDYVPRDRKVPAGESSMWGDYHLMELALMLLREARGESYLNFFRCAQRKAPREAPQP
jgi:unsaturated chondroitin disaccharide hydrolase